MLYDIRKFSTDIDFMVCAGNEEGADIAYVKLPQVTNFWVYAVASGEDQFSFYRWAVLFQWAS
jgi:hypothetical protein